MECSCIKGDSGYNFHVEALDKKTIVYTDLSLWVDDDNYKLPDKYLVVITPPASTTGYEIEMLVGSTNRLTDDELGYIRDGIYCFTVDICGVKATRSRAIFPHLECCVKQAWATLGIERQEEIEKIENHLKLAKINAELNNVQTATKELKIAKILLENIKCDCNC